MQLYTVLPHSPVSYQEQFTQMDSCGAVMSSRWLPGPMEAAFSFSGGGIPLADWLDGEAHDGCDEVQRRSPVVTAAQRPQV